MGTLFIVATPIGNMGDITSRAIETLQTVDAIACEDTRRTGLLISRLKLTRKPQLLSYFEHNEQVRIPEIITRLRNGESIALVSDAGTPAISDPGFKLIRECVKEHIPVQAIPGASSILAALVISGLPTDKFSFMGYMPRKESHVKKLIEQLISLPEGLKQTVIFFESPFRIKKTLKTLQEIPGEREIVLARELTKLHEEVIRGSAETVLAHFSKKEPKGEFVILFTTA